MVISILNIEMYDINWIPYSTANLNLFVFDKKKKKKKKKKYLTEIWNSLYKVKIRLFLMSVCGSTAVWNSR